MRDIVNNIGAVQIVPPQVLSGANTSSAIDLAEFGSAALIVSTGAIVGAGDFTAKLQESDTTTAGDFADVPADFLSGVFPATFAENSVVRVGYSGHKRYVRAVVSKAGGTSIAIGMVLVKGNPRHSPVAA